MDEIKYICEIFILTVMTVCIDVGVIFLVILIIVITDTIASYYLIVN